MFGQRYASDGTPRGSEFKVDTEEGSGPTSVASDANGNFVVVWNDLGYYSADEIYGRRYDASGVPQGGVFHVNTDRGASSPTVASDASGNFVVVWYSYAGGSAYEIFGQHYDSGGVPQGGQFQINSYTSFPQRFPSVWASGTNQFVVVWESDEQDGDDPGVFGQRYSFGHALTVVSPNTNVRWRIGAPERIQWTHDLGADATFRIELDRDDNGEYEELTAAEAPVDGDTKGSYVWTVTGPISATARVRIAWTDDRLVSDTSDVTFQIRPM